MNFNLGREKNGKDLLEVKDDSSEGMRRTHAEIPCSGLDRTPQLTISRSVSLDGSKGGQNEAELERSSVSGDGDRNRNDGQAIGSCDVARPDSHIPASPSYAGVGGHGDPRSDHRIGSTLAETESWTRRESAGSTPARQHQPSRCAYCGRFTSFRNNRMVYEPDSAFGPEVLYTVCESCGEL